MNRLNALLRAATLFVCLFGAASFAHAATFIQLSGDAGDPILDGRELRLTPDDGTLIVFDYGRTDYLLVNFSSPSGSWNLEFSTANGEPRLRPTRE